MERGSHWLTMAHIPFLHKDFLSTVGKCQWVVVPYLVAMEILIVSLIPSGVKQEQNRWPRWISYYSFSTINSETLHISELCAIQYGRALYRLLRQLVLSDPALGTVYILKVDISDRFYSIELQREEYPKPEYDVEDPVNIPLTLPMVRKNSSHLFYTQMQNVTDLANSALSFHIPIQTHKYDNRVESDDKPKSPAIQPLLAALTCDPHLEHYNVRPLDYVDIFIDYFIFISQRHS